MADRAELRVDGKTLIELPIIEGSEGEQAIDIRHLRDRTGLITLDPGYANTGSCRSAVTFIDGDRGILRYRGIPIEELAAKSTFLEVAYLLIYGGLPSKEEYEVFVDSITRHSMIHEDFKRFFGAMPKEALEIFVDHLLLRSIESPPSASSPCPRRVSPIPVPTKASTRPAGAFSRDIVAITTCNI